MIKKTLPVLVAAQMAWVVSCSNSEETGISNKNNSEPRTVYSSTLSDLEPSSLIGLRQIDVLPKVFTDKYSTVWDNSNTVGDYDGIKYRLKQYSALRVVDPSSNLSGNDPAVDDMYTTIIVAACTKYNQDEDFYEIQTGYIPEEMSTDEVMDKARGGEYNKRFVEDGRCDPDGWGPMVPLSKIDTGQPDEGVKDEDSQE